MQLRTAVAILLLGITASLWPSGSSATVTVSPSQPTDQDSVRITVASVFSMSCWNTVAASCTTMAADTLVVRVYLQYCSGGPSCSCPAFPYTYQETCNFGILTAGAYVARFDEVHVNPSDPAPNRTELRSFTVEVSTPTLQRSWGSLKLFYP